MRGHQLLCLAALLLAANVCAVQNSGSRKPTDPRVLLELFVMSRCPDAQRAEARFDQVLKRGLHNITKIQLHFIQDAHGATITCKHGEAECAGNKQLLCVQDKSPGVENYKTFWKFLICMNQSPAEIGQLPLAEHCLEDASKIIGDNARACYTGYEGEGLMRADSEVAPHRGVTKSATIFINGQKRCIHDGGRWYDCEGGYEVEDFVNSICEAYWSTTGEWPAVCGEERLGMVQVAGVDHAGTGHNMARMIHAEKKH